MKCAMSKKKKRIYLMLIEGEQPNTTHTHILKQIDFQLQ